MRTAVHRSRLPHAFLKRSEPCKCRAMYRYRGSRHDRRLQTTVLIVVTHSTRRLTGPVEQVTSVLCPAVLNLFAARIRAGVHITTFSLTPPRTRTRCLLLRVSNAPRSWCQPRWCRPAFSCVMVLAAWRLSRDSCLPSAQTRPRRHAMSYAVSRSVPCAILSRELYRTKKTAMAYANAVAAGRAVSRASCEAATARACTQTHLPSRKSS